jgi:pimeloyl-ACP methyl ester carboxylesterase
MCKYVALLLTWLLCASAAVAAPCAAQDFETQVSGESHCLLMRRYGPQNPDVMVVWLHGNVSTGGPANSHFRIAEQTAQLLGAHRLMAVALVRPGYPDGTGAQSSGSDNGRADNWPRQTVADIGRAIAALREHYQPRTLILVGHSGGAAIAAVLMGLQPGLAQAAVLLACPCDMRTWRAHRVERPWSSEDPLQWTSETPSSVRVLALTGTRDDTTDPSLARTYIERLQARGMDAVFEAVPDAGHIDLLRTRVPVDAVSRLLGGNG